MTEERTMGGDTAEHPVVSGAPEQVSGGVGPAVEAAGQMVSPLAPQTSEVAPIISQPEAAVVQPAPQPETTIAPVPLTLATIASEPAPAVVDSVPALESIAAPGAPDLKIGEITPVAAAAEIAALPPEVQQTLAQEVGTQLQNTQAAEAALVSAAAGPDLASVQALNVAENALHPEMNLVAPATEVPAKKGFLGFLGGFFGRK